MQAYHGHAQALEVLLQGEAEVDQGDEAGRTPLALAALRGHTDCVHTLLSQGASPRAADTQHGRTAVHLAGGSRRSLQAASVWQRSRYLREHSDICWRGPASLHSGCCRMFLTAVQQLVSESEL